MSAASVHPKRRYGWELLIEVPAVIVTFVMMVHVTASALLRTFANSPLPNTLELVQYWYLPFVAFLGFIAAQHRGQHIAADLIYERLPKPSQRFVLALMMALSALASLGFAWFGWQEAVHALEIRKTAGVSALVSWPTYFLVPIAFGSLTVQLAVGAVRTLAHPREEEHFVGDPEDALLLEELARAEGDRK